MQYSKVAVNPSLSAHGVYARRALGVALILGWTGVTGLGCQGEPTPVPGAEESSTGDDSAAQDPNADQGALVGPEIFGDAWLDEVSSSLDLPLWEDTQFTDRWSERLRGLQHAGGDLPTLLPDFTWTPLAEAILEEAEDILAAEPPA